MKDKELNRAEQAYRGHHGQTWHLVGGAKEPLFLSL
jgi:hypothetical protein